MQGQYAQQKLQEQLLRFRDMSLATGTVADPYALVCPDVML